MRRAAWGLPGLALLVALTLTADDPLSQAVSVAVLALGVVLVVAVAVAPEDAVDGVVDRVRQASHRLVDRAFGDDGPRDCERW